MRQVVRAKVTSKGQVTLPIALRRRYAIEPGDELEFDMGGPEPRMVPIKRRSIMDFAGAFSFDPRMLDKRFRRRAIANYLEEKYRRRR